MFKFALGLALAMFCYTAADAACPTFPYTFSNGTTADATQVNADFANVGTCFAPLASPTFSGNLSFTSANPSIISGGSYTTIPNGLYVSGGTLYSQAPIEARGGIYDDTASYLTIGGGTSGISYFSGNVGIGTTAPGYPLTIPFSSGTQAQLGNAYVMASASQNDFSFGSATWAPGSGWVARSTGPSLIYANNSTGIYFYGDTGQTIGSGYTPTPRMVVTNTGNVGIGTTTPISTLQVNGNLTLGTGASSITYTVNTATSNGSDNDGLSLSGAGAASDTSRGAYVSLLGNEVSYYGLYGDAIITAGQATSGSGGAILFATDPTNGSTNNPITRMFVSNGGNVGIGTTTPSQILDVHNGGTGGLLVEGSSGDTSLALLKSDASGTNGNSFELVNTATGSANRLAVGPTTGTGGLTGFTEKLSILNSGSVGIGTTSPAVALAVVGNIRVGISGTNGCLQNFAGTSIAGTCSSDANLKNVVGSVSGVLGRLSNLQLVKFRWNQKAASIYHNSITALNTGFIAQAVEKQFPELVSFDQHGYRQLDYTTLSLYSIEAIKELKSLDDSQTVEIATLKSRLKDTDERLSQAMARVNALTASDISKSRTINDESSAESPQDRSKIMSVAELNAVPSLIAAVKELKSENERLEVLMVDQQARIAALARANTTRASTTNHLRKFIRLGSANAGGGSL